MASKEITTCKRAPRTRREHKKSRRGCRNCKIRRVKCDEEKPHCRQCYTYGAVCNYSPNTPDLQASAQSCQVWQAQPSKSALRQTNALPISLGSIFYSADSSNYLGLNAHSIGQLQQFKFHTIFSFGNNMLATAPKQTKEKLMEYTFLNPYLMHTALAVTAIHDRYLKKTAGSFTVSEALLLAKSTTLFSRKLSQPIQPDDRDPLWAAAAFLGILAFSAVETSESENPWPLKPSEPSDLNWIRVGVQKSTIWKITDPSRPESPLKAWSDDYAKMFCPVPAAGADGVPPTLANICNLGSSSTAENNPYFVEAHILARIYRIPAEQLTMPKTISFFHQMQGSFRDLLQEKDPVALLLLALWYAKAGHSAWWIEQRAALELPAICLYLQRYHRSDAVIQSLLPWKLDQSLQLAYD